MAAPDKATDAPDPSRPDDALLLAPVLDYASPPAPEARYTVGSLSYTRSGLMTVFFWVLWGDFCFQIMELVLPRIFPLYLLDQKAGLGVSNMTVWWIMICIPQIFGIFVGTAVSYKSDRYRGRWGRRIPFIVWTMPFIVLSLVGLGCSEWFRHFFQRSTLPATLHLEPITATILVIGFFSVLFAFGNEFVNSVYWYLFADVVPEAFLGRFFGLFRVVSTGAGMLFSALVFPHAQTHMDVIFLGAALLYGIGFSLMCWKVKEGHYPPPEDIGQRPGIIRQVELYVTQCFSHKMYLATFCYTMCAALAGTAGMGAVIFAKDALHITLVQIGLVAAVVQGISIALAFPTGWLADKVRPLRMLAVMQLLAAPIQFGMFYFQHDFKTYVIFQGVSLIFFALTGAASAPLLMTIFPKEKFGQYASCNGMMKSVALLLGFVVRALHRPHDAQGPQRGRLPLDVRLERRISARQLRAAVPDVSSVEEARRAGQLPRSGGAAGRTSLLVPGRSGHGAGRDGDGREHRSAAGHCPCAARAILATCAAFRQGEHAGATGGAGDPRRRGLGGRKNRRGLPMGTGVAVPAGRVPAAFRVGRLGAQLHRRRGFAGAATSHAGHAARMDTGTPPARCGHPAPRIPGRLLHRARGGGAADGDAQPACPSR